MGMAYSASVYPVRFAFFTVLKSMCFLRASTFQLSPSLADRTMFLKMNLLAMVVYSLLAARVFVMFPRLSLETWLIVLKVWSSSFVKVASSFLNKVMPHFASSALKQLTF